MSARRKVRWIIALALLLGVATGVGVSLQHLRQPARGLPTARVKRGSLDIRVYATGELRASQSVMVVAPSVAGSLRIVRLAKTGTHVRPGDEVVAFDPSEQQYNLEQARFDFQESEQEIAKAQADAAVQGAKGQVDLLKAKFGVRSAQLDVSRNELVSAIDAKKNLLALDEAQRRLAQLEKDIQSHSTSNEAALAVAKEKSHKARLAMQQAEENIKNMVVRATMDGLVAVKENERASGGFYFPGMKLPEYREGDEVGAGSMVAEVLNVGQMEIQSQVEESERANINAGQPVEVRVDAVPDQPFRGKVKSVAGMASREPFWSGNTTSKFDVVIGLDKSQAEFRPGLTVHATIEGGKTQNALFVPPQALFEKDGKPVVYLRSGSGFEPRQVKITSRTESQVALEGLAEDAEVALVNPQERASKGAESSTPLSQPGLAAGGGGQ
jgi:HlyD family secretion protein